MRVLTSCQVFFKYQSEFFDLCYRVVVILVLILVVEVIIINIHEMYHIFHLREIVNRLGEEQVVILLSMVG